MAVKLKRLKEEIIKKAGELAIKYEAQYKGCGQCTFDSVNRGFHSTQNDSQFQFKYLIPLDLI